MGMPDRARAFAQLTTTYRAHPRRAMFGSAVIALGVVLLAVPSLGGTVGPLVVPVVGLVAGVSGLRHSRSIDRRQARVAWSLISVAYLSVTGGLVTFLATLPFFDYAAFGPADVVILLGYVTWGIGIALIPSAIQERSERIRVVIDALVGATSLVAVSWVLFLDEVWSNLANAPTFDRFVGSGYALIDIVVIIVTMSMLLRRSAYRFDLRLAFIAAGLLFQVAGDLTYVFSGAGRTFAEVEPIFGLFVIAFGCHMLGALMIPYRPAALEYAERLHPPMWPLLAPYGAAIAMVVMLIATVSADDFGGGVGELLIATVIVGVLVVLRQFAAIKENRQHVERERRALISTISHELRTPLTAMVGFLDLITSDEAQLEQEERAEMIEVVDQQARYMSRIVSDLVLLARGKSEQIELDVGQVTVLDIVHRSITSLDSGLNNARVLVSPELTAIVDSDRILQALVNLLSNAVRYGGDDRAIVATAEGSTLHLEVHDSGPGVPVRHQLAVWERFERGANRLNAMVPGSGIGLAIVRAVTNAHGGSVGYRTSELLGGSCFYVTLPNCVTRAPAPNHAVAFDSASPELEQPDDRASHGSAGHSGSATAVDVDVSQ